MVPEYTTSPVGLWLPEVASPLSELQMEMLIAYRNKKRKKLLLRVFINRLMIFIYKIIIVVSENRRN